MVIVDRLRSQALVTSGYDVTDSYDKTNSFHVTDGDDVTSTMTTALVTLQVCIELCQSKYTDFIHNVT